MAVFCSAKYDKESGGILTWRDAYAAAHVDACKPLLIFSMLHSSSQG